MADGFHQMQIGGEFPLADTAQQLHDPGTEIVAVNGGHIVHPVGPGGHGAQLEVHKIHMIGQQNVRGLHILHVDFLDLIGDAPGHEQLRHQLQQMSHKLRLPDGELRRVIGDFISVIDFHKRNLSNHFSLIFVHYI